MRHRYRWTSLNEETVSHRPWVIEQRSRKMVYPPVPPLRRYLLVGLYQNRASSLAVDPDETSAPEHRARRHEANEESFEQGKAPDVLLDGPNGVRPKGQQRVL